MKQKKKIISLLLAVLMLAATLVSCGGTGKGGATETQTELTTSEETTAPDLSEPAEGSHYPLTISTFNFELEPVEYTFEQMPERVITFWTGPMETMLALGLGDKIVCAVGVEKEEILEELWDEFDKVAEGAEYNEFVDTNAAMSREYAIMLQPDFIFGWKSSFSEKTIGDVDYWHENNIGTYMSLNSNDVSENRTIENEYKDILTIGKIFDVEDKAQEIVDEISAEVERVTTQIKGQEKKTVMIIEFLGDRIWSYDKTMLAGNMVTAMGGELLETEKDIGAEDILTQDPDVIFLISSSDDAVSEFVNDPAYASLSAIAGEDVYSIPLSEVYNSGVRTINGLNMLGSAMYPELYSE